MKFLGTWLLIFLTLVSATLYAVPLDLYTTYVTAYPQQSKKGQWIQLMARGTGTNDMYVMEVDPTTGALPVNVVAGTITATNPSVGLTGAPVPTSGTYAAGINPSGNLTGFSVTSGGILNVAIANDTNYGTPGATTLRAAAMLGVGSTAVSNANPVPISDAGGTITVDGTVAVNGITGTVSLPTGASTAALQSAGNTSLVTMTTNTGATATNTANTFNILNDDILPSIQSIEGYVANLDVFAAQLLGYGTATTAPRFASMIGVGTAVVSNSNPVPISDAGGTITVDGTVAVSNLPATANTNYGTVGASTIRTAAQVGNATGAADFGTGSAGAQTIRVVTASNSPEVVGPSYSDSTYMSYSSTNVTTGAWVQLDASTAATFNYMTIFSSCGETIELGTGAPASETRVLLIPPGGIDAQIKQLIASGSRLALRGVSGNCTTGQISLTGFN